MTRKENSSKDYIIKLKRMAIETELRMICIVEMTVRNGG